MKNHLNKNQKAFSLVEILIVIAVLAMIAVFASFTVMDAIAKARDSQRIQEIESLAEALNYYYIANENYPCESEGMNGYIGVGGDFDAEIESYMADLPADPKHNGSEYYYYDAYHSCLGGPEDDYFAALMISSFETDSYRETHSNLEDACPYTWGAEGPTEPDYVIKLYPYCD